VEVPGASPDLDCERVHSVSNLDEFVLLGYLSLFSHAAILEWDLTNYKRFVRFLGMVKKKVVGYLRVSTREQATDGVSLDAQRVKLEAYAVAMDLEIVRFEVDAGISAKTIVDRPGLVRALQSMEDGDSCGIIVAKLDRLSRSLEDMCRLTRVYFRDGKFSLICVADQINTDTAAGRMVLNMLMTIAEWERDIIGERTKEALGYLQSQGVRLGRLGMGERYSGEVDSEGRKMVEVCEYGAETRRIIQECRSVSKMSYQAIADYLNDLGRPTRGGRGVWAKTSVREVFIRC